MSPSASEFAATLTRHLERRDRTLAWLSRQSGIPYSRLYSKVKKHPQNINVEEMLVICDALGINIAEFWGFE